MKRKNYRRFFSAFLAAIALSSAWPLTANAETSLSERMGDTPVQYGASGYPIVVPDPKEEGCYVQTDQAAYLASHPDYYLLGNNGLYELDGQVVYLLWSRPQKVALVQHNEKNADGTYTTYPLYCDAEGRVMPYNDETKAAVDADINAHLLQTEGNVQTLYGASFLHRDAFSTYENYRFAKYISDALASYPAGSVKLITDGTKAVTGKEMRFRSIYLDSDQTKATDWIDGTYDYQTNIVNTSGGRDTTAHEMGHGMESVLNKASGGRLQADFAALNGGASYSLYYFYAGGDPALLNAAPPCFRNSYSGTSFAEDFADTFADALCYTMGELEEDYRSEPERAAYLQKVSYVKQLFNQYAGAAILQ